MHYEIDTATETVRITCTLEEIARLEDHHAVWATPTPDGLANQLYLSSQPRFRYDFILANAEDFLAAEGWTSTGWNDMSEEEQESEGQRPSFITLPRSGNPRFQEKD